MGIKERVLEIWYANAWRPDREGIEKLIDLVIKERNKEVMKEIETLKRQLKYYKKRVGYVKELKKSGEDG